MHWSAIIRELFKYLYKLFYLLLLFLTIVGNGKCCGHKTDQTAHMYIYMLKNALQWLLNAMLAESCSLHTLLSHWLSSLGQLSSSSVLHTRSSQPCRVCPDLLQSPAISFASCFLLVCALCSMVDYTVFPSCSEGDVLEAVSPLLSCWRNCMCLHAWLSCWQLLWHFSPSSLKTSVS